MIPLAELIERFGTASTKRERVAASNEIKMSVGCECPDCQWQGPFPAARCLEFDHLQEKLFSITYAVYSLKAGSGPGRVAYDYGKLSWHDVLAEMTKCRVVCAVCHRAEDQKKYDSGDRVHLRSIAPVPRPVLDKDAPDAL